MKKKMGRVSSALIISSVLFLWGCSSSPSKEQINQLESMQSEISSLSKKVNSLQQEKSGLQIAVKDKQTKLSALEADKKAVELKINNAH